VETTEDPESGIASDRGEDCVSSGGCAGRNVMGWQVHGRGFAGMQGGTRVDRYSSG
jgi:hypothetical protein